MGLARKGLEGKYFSSPETRDACTSLPEHTRCRVRFCNPRDCSLPGSSVRGILQAIILEWVAVPSSRGIFQTQESNPHPLCLLHCQADSLPLSNLGIIF